MKIAVTGKMCSGKTTLCNYLCELEPRFEIFSFGKYKGRTVEDVFNENPGYNAWIQNADFPLYTKKVLKEIKERMSIPKKGLSDSDKLQALQQKFNLR